MPSSDFIKKAFLMSLIVLSSTACRTLDDWRRPHRDETNVAIGQDANGPVEIIDLPPLDDDNMNQDSGGMQRIPALASNRPVITTPTWRTMAGSWRAQDSTGNCKVTLSSAATLDFYKASTSGCSNKDLSKVSSWEYRDGEVYLYRSGGTVVARLKGSSGQLSGALQASGAALSMSK